MKYLATLILMMASPAVAHTGADIHIHHAEAMALTGGVGVCALIVYFLRSRS